METLTLQRRLRNEFGTFGDLHNQGIHECYTLERMWLNNASNISCIPAGEYLVTIRKGSAKFPYTHFELHEVEGRSMILIHRGNWIIDTHGCILVGVDIEKKGIGQSKKALDKLVTKYPNGFMLVVKD